MVKRICSQSAHMAVRSIISLFPDSAAHFEKQFKSLPKHPSHTTPSNIPTPKISFRRSHSGEPLPKHSSHTTPSNTNSKRHCAPCVRFANARFSQAPPQSHPVRNVVWATQESRSLTTRCSTSCDLSRTAQHAAKSEHLHS